MGIKFLGIEGFRSLRKVDWSPGALNVIIGPNGSGKSNLLKALDLMIAAATSRLQRHLDEQGSIGLVAFDETDRDISVRLTIDGNGEDTWSSRYTMLLSRIGEIDYRIGLERFIGIPKDSASQTIFERKPSSPLSSQLLSPETARAFGGLLDKPETLLASADSPFVTEKALKDTQRAIASWQLLDGWHTERNASVRQAVVSRVETRLERVGQNLANVLHTLYELNHDFKERIDMAMTAAFGGAYGGLVFPPGSGKQIQLGVRWAPLKHPQLASDLSDGTLRFLFLIAALSQPDLPALIAIDEPETGLHPSMMRIIAEYAEDASLRTQVLFTTHSAAFLDAFSRESPPQTTVATIEDGETHLKIVDPELLSRWLVEYSLGTLYESLELEQMPSTQEIAA